MLLDCRALALVDQISFKGSGQFDGCALSIVALIESSIGASQATTLRISTQPGASIHPVAHWLRSFRVRQFVLHHRGSRDCLGENRKYADVFDKHQIGQGASIGDYDDHPD